MATYIKTIKQGSDIILPVTSSEALADSVPSDKIDWTSFDSTEWPVVNDNAVNNNVNSNQWYNQYQYTVPADGLYLVLFTQRRTGGDNNNDFSLRILHHHGSTDTGYSTIATGGSTWVNWIPGTTFALIQAESGDIFYAQSIGGGTGSYGTQNGKVSIARIR